MFLLRLGLGSRKCSFVCASSLWYCRAIHLFFICCLCFKCLAVVFTFGWGNFSLYFIGMSLELGTDVLGQADRVKIHRKVRLPSLELVKLSLVICIIQVVKCLLHLCREFSCVVKFEFLELFGGPWASSFFQLLTLNFATVMLSCSWTTSFLSPYTFVWWSWLFVCWCICRRICCCILYCCLGVRAPKFTGQYVVYRGQIAFTFFNEKLGVRLLWSGHFLLRGC